MILHSILFIVSVFFFWVAGELLINSLVKIAKFLKWREFTVAFFTMAFAGSLPNLLVGISSAVRGVPELSFGDIAGNNIAILTIGLGLAVLICKGEMPADSKMVQTSSIFVTVSALLPLFLIFDGVLSRADGILLIGFFIFYIAWLFSRQDRFKKVYEDAPKASKTSFLSFLKGLLKVFLGLFIFIAAAQGIVVSSQYFSVFFALPIVLIGVLITGFSSALPEIYFSFISAKRGETWMILGNIMGAVIVPATLVLGIVALIHPIYITDFSTIAVARFFIVISALSFLLFVRSKQKIDKKEGFILLLIYLVFLITTVFFHDFFAQIKIPFLD